MRSPEFDSRAVNRSLAFTRVELTASLAGTALLLWLAVPVVAARRGTPETATCFGSLRQLTRAWLLYAEDHAGLLPGNVHGGGGALDPATTNRAWATGWLDNSVFRSHNTNVALVRDAQLGRYLESPSVFRCPLDPGLTHGKIGGPRVRSVSMNSYVGDGGLGSGPYTGGYRQFRSLSSITAPSPSECFVFIEEREDSINDPWFAIEMRAFEPNQPASRIMLNYPADWHDGNGILSFADGHVETWRWIDPRSRPAHRPGVSISLGVDNPDNPDVFRLQSAASRKTIP